MADSADLGHLDFQDCGSFEGGFSCDPDRAAEVQELFLATVASVHTDLPSDAEVKRAASRLAADAALRCDTPAERLFALGLENLYTAIHAPTVTPEATVGRLQAATPAQVQQVLSLCSLRQPSGALLLPAS
ncbi:hypothetical protein [Deinococcus radiophilus]|uniref:hypothetical protein n=1 Tax=Deinococcus radiophilus TaxID=32062 RepID=UPI00361D7786